ncbi:pilin [Patescibacteria group bacterium]
MKKLFLGIFLASLLCLPLVSFAGEYMSTSGMINYEGLVPCGKNASGLAPGESPQVAEPCQLCHLFVMFDAIIDFVMELVIIIAVLMFTVGGVMFFFGGQNPSTLTKARSILTATVWGLVIIFSAWIIVNTVFTFIGVADWTGLKTGWFSINCDITF